MTEILRTPNQYLRAARDEVALTIPLLAPQLSENFEIVKGAIHASLENQDVDPARFAPHDINKAERYAFASFSIDVLQDEMVAGTGRDSYFPEFEMSLFPALYMRAFRFSRAIDRVQDLAARRVAARYTYGIDESYRWWPLAKQRFQYLGKAALAHDRNTPEEGKDLEQALRTKALSSGSLFLCDFINRNMPHATEEERVAAGHDLQYIPTTLASVHFLQFIAIAGARQPRPKASIGKDGAGVYRATMKSESRYWTRVKVPRGLLIDGRLPTTTLKCPAHTELSVSHHDDLGVDAGLEVDMGSTNLQKLLHASTNASADAGMLKGPFFMYVPF